MIIARVQMLVFLVDEIKIEYVRNEVYQFQVWMMFALMAAAHHLLHSTPARAPAAGARAPSQERPFSAGITP